ncbi:hypothetical protein D3C76_1215430 [compost metagenome]
MALEVFQAQEQALVDGLAQLVHGAQVLVAGLGLAGVDPLDLVAANGLAHLLGSTAPNPRRVEFAFGITAPALGRQRAHQVGRQKERLLGPAMGGQIVDDGRKHRVFRGDVHGAHHIH